MSLTLYTRRTPVCAVCEMTKKYCKEKNILFKEIVIGEDITLEEFKQQYPEQRALPLILNAKGEKIESLNELKRKREEAELKNIERLSI